MNGEYRYIYYRMYWVLHHTGCMSIILMSYFLSSMYCS